MIRVCQCGKPAEAELTAQYLAWRCALEILLIMPALCSMLFNAHYAQNYGAIIGARQPNVYYCA